MTQNYCFWLGKTAIFLKGPKSMELFSERNHLVPVLPLGFGWRIVIRRNHS